MDAVITYVNGLDPLWQESYSQATNTSALDKRFRDWGTLKYLLRGIEKNMPFIKKVYLVVSSMSQVPQWVDTEELKIVLHEDIIPHEFLPTFNCNTIITHLQQIPGLDERYIFFNDDCFPVLPCRSGDFFTDDGIKFGFTPHIFTFHMYKKICRNSDKAARMVAGKKPSLLFYRPQHICSPMLRSACRHVYEKASDQIKESITTIREEKNISEYIFLDYMYHSGKVLNKRLSKKHFSMATASPEKISSFLKHPTHKFVCINDVQLSVEKEAQMRKSLEDAFETILTEKSRFEK